MLLGLCEDESRIGGVYGGETESGTAKDVNRCVKAGDISQGCLCRRENLKEPEGFESGERACPATGQIAGEVWKGFQKGDKEGCCRSE